MSSALAPVRPAISGVTKWSTVVASLALVAGCGAGGGDIADNAMAEAPALVVQDDGAGLPAAVTPEAAADAGAEAEPAAPLEYQMEQLSQDDVVEVDGEEVTAQTTEINYPVFTGAGPAVTAINTGIEQFVAERLAEAEAQADEARDFILEFAADRPDVYYSYLTDATVTLNRSGLVGVRFIVEVYTGGAHPSIASDTSLVFDAATGEQLGFDDLFVSADAVRDQATEAFTALIADQPDMFFDEAAQTLADTDFTAPQVETGFGYYLTDDGVTFLFLPYSLAPGATGTVEAPVMYTADLVRIPALYTA